MNDVILLEQFHGKDIRIIHKPDKNAMIPVNDIADALGYDRQPIHSIIKRYTELFEPLQGIIVTMTPGGPQNTLCLKRDGVVGLLMRLDYNRIKDPARRSLIIEFQKWAIDTLGRIMGGDIKLPLPEYQNESIRAAMEAFRAADLNSMKATDRAALFRMIGKSFTTQTKPRLQSVAPGAPISINADTQAEREANAGKLLAWLKDEYVKQGDKLGFIQDDWLMVHRVTLRVWARQHRLNLTILLRELHRQGLVQKHFKGGRFRYSDRKRVDGKVSELVWFSRKEMAS